MAATAHVMSLGPIAVAAQPAPELAQRLARCAAPACYLDFARHDRLASRVCAEEKRAVLRDTAEFREERSNAASRLRQV